MRLIFANWSSQVMALVGGLVLTANAWSLQEHSFRTPPSRRLFKLAAAASTSSSKTVLTYRNSPDPHEEHHLTTDNAPSTTSHFRTAGSLFLPSLSPQGKKKDSLLDKEAGVHSSTNRNGLNREMIRGLIMGQMGFLGVTLVIAFLARVPTIASSSFRLASPSLFLPLQNHGVLEPDMMISATLAGTILLAVGSVLGMVGVEKIVDSVAQRPASRIHFGTSNLVVTLFGRRARRDKGSCAMNDPPFSSSAVPTTSTTTALWHTLLLAGGTSATQETIFRWLIPALLFQFTHSVGMALVGQALLFGLYHVSPVSLQEKENQVLVAMQTVNGLVYAGLLVASGGSLWSCILAHMLYDLHVMTSSWHAVNDQIDWAQDHTDIEKELLSSNDAKVLAALQEHSRGALTPENMQVLHRFFYAFDTDHQGYLSLQDVHKAISYSFWTMETEPSEAHVDSLFSAILAERPSDSEAGTGKQPEQPSDRLSWVEFVRLLVSLRAYARRQLKEQQQQQQNGPRVAL